MVSVTTVASPNETTATRRFRYVVRDADGKRRRGTIEARSHRGARTLLMEQGLSPTKVREKAGLNVEIRAKRVSPTELMHFSRQLAAFTRAGVPILEALDGIARSSDNKTLKHTLADVNDALRAGQNLTNALREHPKVFPPYYHTAIRAAERTGRLDVTLDRLSDYLEREIENRRKVKAAFAYPSVIMVFALIVVIILTTVVMPRFESFFASLGGTLPLPTRMLIGIMDFLISWGWLVLLIAIAVGFATSAASKTQGGRALLDRAVLKLPGLGPLVSTALVERFCRALGSMTEAAVPLPDALEIAAEGTSNTVFKDRILEAREQMLEGEGLAGPMEGTELFPTAATQMIRAGEATGSIEEQLLNTADFYEKELDYRLKRFTTLFEPAVILFAGLIVGFVAVALVSAMYGLVTEIPL